MINPTVEEFVKSTMKMLHQICKEQHRNYSVYSGIPACHGCPAKDYCELFIWDNYDLFAPNGWEMDTE